MQNKNQRHAAQSRHTKAIESKRLYFKELSACFATYRLDLPLKSRLTNYASSRRNVVSNHASRFGFKESTLRTWLREWKSRTSSGV